jgi:hypothetical protein
VSIDTDFDGEKCFPRIEAARRTVSGQGAIYQSEQMPGVWLDISKEEFDLTHHGRIVYAAPIPATEPKDAE